VQVGGLDLPRESLAIRQQLGYLPEGVPLYPELRVEEYLDFHGRLRGLKRRARLAALDRVLQLCGLREERRALVRQLSRGYRQRLGLANALLGEPSLVSLDPHQLRQMRALIRDLSPRQTVLFSSHQLAEVEAICSRVLILAQGRLVADEPLRPPKGPLDAAGRWASVLVELRLPSQVLPAEPIGRLKALGRVSDVEHLGPVLGDDGALAPPLSSPAIAETPSLDSSARVLRLRVLGPELGEEVGEAIIHAGWHLRELRRGEPLGLEQLYAQHTTLAPSAGGAREEERACRGSSARPL
jgi:energy-coupling factor transporter ATP-binding protein EcfA2